MRIQKLTAFAAAFIAGTSLALAAPHTKDDAVAMVKKAVAAIKVEGANKVYAEGNKGDKRFINGEIYIVVQGLDGINSGAFHQPEAGRQEHNRRAGRRWPAFCQGYGRACEETVLVLVRLQVHESGDQEESGSRTCTARSSPRRGPAPASTAASDEARRLARQRLSPHAKPRRSRTILKGKQNCRCTETPAHRHFSKAVRTIGAKPTPPRHGARMLHSRETHGTAAAKQFGKYRSTGAPIK